MVKCAVAGCKHDSRRQSKKNDDITFHRFPANKEYAEKWKEACNRPGWEPKHGSINKICSVHFTPSALVETQKGRHMLVPNAVPELKLSPADNIESITPCNHPEVHRSQKKRNIKTKLKPTTQEKTTKKEESEVRFKRRIKHLQVVAKKRRQRCNALYVQVNRLKKKVDFLEKCLKAIVRKG